MKKIVAIVSIALLLSTNVYLLLKLVYKEYVSDEETGIGGFAQEYVTSNVIGMDMLLRNGGLPLDSAKVFRTDDGSCDLFSDGTKRYLVCRISEYDCESCTAYALGKLASVCADEFDAKPLVLANYKSDRSLEIVHQRHSDMDRIDFLRMEDVYFPAEQAGMPYFFILDDNMKINDVFVPDRTLPEMTSRYFEKLRDKYSLMDARS